MKSSLIKSLRLKLMLYSITSIFMALVTEAAIGTLFYFIARMMGVANGGYGLPKKTTYLMGPAIHHRQKNFLEHLLVLKKIDNNTLFTFFVATIILGIILFFIYFFLLTRNISRDLRCIANRITVVAEGKPEEPFLLKRNDEIGEIALRLNEMTERVGQLMEAEREALQTNKDLITCVAHDLRTPLTSVIGYLQLAMNTEKYDVEEQQKYAWIASQKANRLEGLIQDLFSYTKLMSGEITLHRSNIDIVKLVEQMVEEFYPLFQENRLEYQMKQNVDSLIMNVDSELIARTVQNLLSNAIKYGRDGKQILVTLEKMEKEMHLSVTNFGLVIPPESLELIFEKFYRVEGSRSRQTGGTGLGLNIAKEIVTLHGGNIRVESGIDGTVFIIALPLQEDSESISGENQKKKEESSNSNEEEKSEEKNLE